MCLTLDLVLAFGLLVLYLVLKRRAEICIRGTRHKIYTCYFIPSGQFGKADICPPSCLRDSPGAIKIKRESDSYIAAPTTNKAQTELGHDDKTKYISRQMNSTPQALKLIEAEKSFCSWKKSCPRLLRCSELRSTLENYFKTVRNNFVQI